MSVANRFQFHTLERKLSTMNLFPSTIPWPMIKDIGTAVATRKIDATLFIQLIYVLGCLLSYAMSAGFIQTVMQQLATPLRSAPFPPEADVDFKQLGGQFMDMHDQHSNPSTVSVVTVKAGEPSEEVGNPAVVIGIISLVLQVFKLFIRR